MTDDEISLISEIDSFESYCQGLMNLIQTEYKIDINPILALRNELIPKRGFLKSQKSYYDIYNYGLKASFDTYPIDIRYRLDKFKLYRVFDLESLFVFLKARCNTSFDTQNHLNFVIDKLVDRLFNMALKYDSEIRKVISLILDQNHVTNIIQARNIVEGSGVVNDEEIQYKYDLHGFGCTLENLSNGQLLNFDVSYEGHEYRGFTSWAFCTYLNSIKNSDFQPFKHLHFIDFMLDVLYKRGEIVKIEALDADWGFP